MATSGTNQFYYQPISKPLEFRILHLLPGKTRNGLRCELQSAQLDSPPSYEALSYTWGDPKAKETILCNGKKLEIGKSLSSALHTLRYTDRKRTLWIDAVCINQEDKQEKNIQVPLMCDIYRQADRVV